MKTFLIIPVLSLCFMNTACGFDKSKLPEKMPKETVIGFNASYGMSPAYKTIVIKNGEFVFDAKDYVPEKKGYVTTKWVAKMDSEDILKLYQVFIDNRFDIIKNDKAKVIVYDASGESVYINLNSTTTYQVSYSDNEPLSGDNLKHYQAVQKAIENLAAKYSPKKQTIADDEKQQIFEFDRKDFNWIAAGAKPTVFTKSDFAVMETVLQNTIRSYDAKQKTINEKVGNYSDYKRQLIPYVNAKGEKEVWINYFCNENGVKWRKTIVAVDGGGSCYFTLTINLTTKKVSDFIVNGAF